MISPLQRHRKSALRRFAYQSIAVCLGGTMIAGLSSAKAFSQESVLEPAIESAIEPTAERAVEPTAEPTAEPAATESSAIAPPASDKLRALFESIVVRPTVAPVSAEVAPEMMPTAAAEATATTEQTVRLRLSLSDRKVYVYRGETIEATYPVAVGKAGWETPTGEFKVITQINQPGWTNPFTDEVMPPGPDNPLGDRWIGFWTDGNNTIGFHGTPNRESVGRAASHGCVRMYNEDIRKLFEIVALGTPVTVEP